eukprot:SAG31_NODE_3414_length_4302_cov_20.546239_2_plen_163_part_00
MRDHDQKYEIVIVVRVIATIAFWLQRYIRFSTQIYLHGYWLNAHPHSVVDLRRRTRTDRSRNRRHNLCHVPHLPRANTRHSPRHRQIRGGQAGPAPMCYSVTARLGWHGELWHTSPCQLGSHVGSPSTCEPHHMPVTQSSLEPHGVPAPGERAVDCADDSRS